MTFNDDRVQQCNKDKDACLFKWRDCGTAADRFGKEMEGCSDLPDGPISF